MLSNKSNVGEGTAVACLAGSALQIKRSQTAQVCKDRASRDCKERAGDAHLGQGAWGACHQTVHDFRLHSYHEIEMTNISLRAQGARISVWLSGSSRLMFVLGGAGWPLRRLPAATWPHLTTSGSVFDLPKFRVSAFEVMVLWLAGLMPSFLGPPYIPQPPRRKYAPSEKP